jgi:MraZ protein
MFLGEYRHSLDAKGRVILPAKHRSGIEGGAFISKLDGCLAVYPPEEFNRVAEAMQEKQRRGHAERNAVRLFMAGSAEIEPDRQGRIAIPANLREFADLQTEVVIAGVGARLELWNPERWERLQAEGEDTFAAASDETADIGI